MKVTVCGGCGGADLRAALEGRLPAGAELAVTDCMVVCAKPVTLSVRAPGKAAYLFSGVGAEQAHEVATFARLFDASPDGVVADVRPIGALRFQLVGRIPA